MTAELRAGGLAVNRNRI
ncbi:hypothetical protein ACIBL5_36355 [Streptomyces sp. NPDC050516]